MSYIESILALLLIFWDISQEHRILLGCLFIAILIIIYLILWRKANKVTSIQLQINNSIVNVEAGDIFKYDCLKVITFNEYFDTIVDNDIISSNSLNGIFINSQVQQVDKLDSDIANDHILQEKKICQNESRRKGKLIRYSLGATYLFDDEYILTAFTHFTDDNKAFLTMSDFLQFLTTFWDQLDRIYSGRSVVIPLLGSGITRFKGYDMVSDQELLEIIIWSYKVSRVKFTYPSTITFVINESKKDKINFYEIKWNKYYDL